MRIRITQTVQASPNGITAFLYAEGEEYGVPSPKMPQSLAETFLQEKWAEQMEAEERQEDEEEAEDKEKDQGGAAENKDAGPAPENKQSGKKKKGWFGKK